jgi:hypothetical protein
MVSSMPMNKLFIIWILISLLVGYLSGVVHQVTRQKKISKLERELEIQKNKGFNAVEMARYFYNENKKYQQINRPYDYALDA